MSVSYAIQEEYLDSSATVNGAASSDPSVDGHSRTVGNESDGPRDEILRLRAQLAVLKDVIEAKDQRMQEYAINAKITQVKLEEEGAQLARSNAALREEVLALNETVSLFEHVVNDRNHAANEQNKDLHEDYENVQTQSRIQLGKNTALEREIAHLNVGIKLRDNLINAWKNLGETWEPKFRLPENMSLRKSEDEICRGSEEGERIPSAVTNDRSLPSSGPGTEETLSAFLSSSVFARLQATGLPQEVSNDEPNPNISTVDLTRSDTPPSNVASVLNTKQRSRPGNHSNGSTRGPFDSVGPSHDIFRNSTTADPSTPPRRPKYAPSLLWSPMSSMSPYNTPLAPPAKDVLNTTGVTLPDAPAVSRDHGTDAGGISLKRKRGRPKGSRNKNRPPCVIALSEVPKRKRGRPPKEKRPVLGPDGQPLPKRPRGRPRKSGSGNPTYRHEDDISRSRRDTATQSSLSTSIRPAEVPGNNAADPWFDPLYELEGAPVPTDVSRVESDASVQQNGQLTLIEIARKLPNLDTEGIIKEEPNEFAGLNQHHLELIYQLEDEKLFCGLCARAQVSGAPVLSFQVGTPKQKLLKHCSMEHPRECARLVLVSHEQLAEMRNRMLEG